MEVGLDFTSKWKFRNPCISHQKAKLSEDSLRGSKGGEGPQAAAWQESRQILLALRGGKPSNFSLLAQSPPTSQWDRRFPDGLLVLSEVR